MTGEIATSVIALWFARDLGDADDVPRHTKAPRVAESVPVTGGREQRITKHECDLIARVIEGDRQAFDQLARHHWDDLWRYAYHLVRGADAADDLVQDALFALWMKRERIEAERGVRGFLFGVMRKRFLEIHRHNTIVSRIEHAHLPAEVSGAASGGESSGPVLETELVHILSTFMDALPEQRRTVLLLRWWHGMAYEEIADATGMGVSAVKMFVKRSAGKLRELIPPEMAPPATHPPLM